MDSTSEARFQAVKEAITNYMKDFTSEFKLRESAFMDFDAEYFTNRVLDAINAAECVVRKEADLETEATEKHD